MRRNSHFSLALALVAGSATVMSLMVPANAAHAAQKKDKKNKKGKEEAPSYDLSKEYREQVGKVQELLKAEDHAATEAAIKQLETVTKTDDEKYFTGQMYLNLAVKTQNKDFQRIGIEKSLATQRLGEADRGKYNYILGEIAFNDTKDYAKARDYFTKAQSAGYDTSLLNYQLGEAKFNQAINQSGGSTINAENYALAQEGLAHYQRALELPDERGILDKGILYRRATNIAATIKSPDTMKWAKGYVTAAPSGDSWNLALALLRSQAGYKDQTNLDLMRLMRRADAMKTSGDYGEYIENANSRSLPGEVLAVLQEGNAAGIVDSSDTFFAEASSIAQGRVTDDKAELPASEKAARSSADGGIALATGDAYLGYDEPAKAAAMYALALEKGNIDRDRALTRLAIANIDMGNYDEARTQLTQIAGERKPLADMWMLWVDQNSANTSGQ